MPLPEYVGRLNFSNASVSAILGKVNRAIPKLSTNFISAIIVFDNPRFVLHHLLVTYECSQLC